MLLSLLAGGCATRAAIVEVQGELATTRAELTEVRLAQDLMAAELARVLAELQSLDNRLTRTQETVGESVSQVEHLRTLLQTSAEAHRQTHATPPRVGVAAPSAPTLPPANTPPAAMPTPVDAERPGEAAGAEPAEQAYAAALNTLRAREHGQAVLDFLDVIARYPTHPLAPHAQYWIGEAYYVDRDYRHALVEFHRVLELTPEASNVADALLRIGMCHAELGEAAPAAAMWQRVVRDHPRSDAASIARSLLRAAASTRQP